MERNNAVVKDKETHANNAADKATKQKKKVVSLTKNELQKLARDFIVQCDPSTAPQRFKAAAVLYKCELCKRHFETGAGAKGHTQEKKHVEKKNLKKVEEALKLVGSPNEEQFEAITVKLQQVYDEWSAEACGQQTVREKIVSDFQEFVQQTKGCEGVVVQPFGSTYTKFALKSSDINMNLMFGDRTVTDPSSYYPVISSVVERLTTMANGSGDDVVYTDLKNNLYSSVSHITFTHRPSGLSCHVRFGCHHGVPICTSKLLRRYGEIDHRVKVLAVVWKYWAKLCQLDIQELGSYPSQMFVLMLVHFLQRRSPPILPVPPKPNDFSDTQQCLEHFDEYLSGLNHMIKTWKVTNTESLGMLWLGMFRFYCEEADLNEVVIHITEKDLLMKKDMMTKKDGNWSTNKLVVLSPVHPTYNMAKACSSQNMYLYLKICFKATMVYFGRNSLNKPSSAPPLAKDDGKPQDETSQEASHDPCTTEKDTPTAASSPKHTNSYLSNVTSQLSDFTDNSVEQSKSKEPIRLADYLNDSDLLNQTHKSCDTTTRSHDPNCDTSNDLDYDTSYDLDHNESVDPDHNVSHDLDHDDTSEVETSCEHNDTQVEDSVVVEDIEVNDDADGVDDDRGFQYEFVSSNFTVKKLPDVCSLCKQEGHTFTSPDCPDREEDIKLAKHPLPSLEQLEQLDTVFIDLKENICLKPIHKRQRREVCHILEQFIKAIYPDAKLMLFGSSANEFGSPTSDIDISMKLPGNFEHDDKAEVIQKVAHELKYKRQYHWWVNTVQPITTARVPIVKMQLMAKWNDLDCDISLGNYLALHNTELLATYASIDRRVQVLGYVLKEFAKSSEMCDASSGSLSSYAYILLLLHYLQQVTPPVIPVLQQIGKVGCVDVDGWNCWFYRFDHLSELEKIWPHVGENKSTVGELLINFFKYYLEEFNWRRHVVCIRQLELLSKLEKQWASKRACIEDPFNHDHNLSSHLSNRMWSYIRNAFKCAHDHITDPQLYTQPVTISSVLSVGFAKNVPQDGLCHSCGKRGHISRNCPNNAHRKPSYSCYRCGKKGHVRADCTAEIEQGESPDGSSKSPLPSALEMKKRKKTKVVLTKVVEVKSEKPMVMPISPKSKHATPGLLPHPHNHEYPSSPKKQSNLLLPDPSTASPPHATQFLPPYPQPHPSVPYTASRHPNQPPMAPQYNQQPQARYTVPMSVPISMPSASAPTRPFIMTSPHTVRPSFAEFNNSPPRHHSFSHTMNFMQQQSPPAAYGSGIYNNSGSYYLFPPPSSPANAVPQGGYEQICTVLKQTEKPVQHQQQQPHGHNPYTMPATYDKDNETCSRGEAEMGHKHKKSKSKSTKPVTEIMGLNATDSTQVTLADVKQGRPATRVNANRRQPIGRGRGRTQREMSAFAHHSGRHQQHQQNT